MTTVFLIRHSVRMPSSDISSIFSTGDVLVQREKIILSIEGEERAKLLSDKSIFDDVDVIYTSNCVRTLQTAKYLMARLGLKANIDERLDERRAGKPNDDLYPDWLERQYFDENFKTIGGESQVDVRKRVDEAISEILKKHKNQTIAIFSHGYAITFYLLKYCKLENVDGGHLTYSFHGDVFFDKKINAPEVFHLTFDKDKLKDIKVISFDDIPYNHGV